ncbi:coiled-coil domain-containing protein 157-like [Glandiceps talaboti]
MAHLLGSKLCIESLSSDVGDLQSAIHDVFSRVGPVRFPSWKYPDKVSCDVNIGELLEEYIYDDADEEDNQVSHIMMFELTIDRLMLLIQSFTRFLDQMLGSSPSGGSDGIGPQMSIGLAIRKFWNKMVQVYTNYQHVQSENKTKNRTIAKLENAVGALHEENLKLRPQDVRASGIFHIMGQEGMGQAFQSQTSPGLGGIIPPNRMEDPFYQRPVEVRRDSIAKDTRTVPCQTLETAFVPCGACATVQLGLKEVSNMIVDVCKTQGLPSSVAKHKAQEHQSVMSSNDVSRWVGEQSKDLSRINKHLENLMNTIEPLKSDLAASQEKCVKLDEKVNRFDKDLKKEKEKQSSLIRQHEAKLKEVEKTHQDSITIVERTNNDLKSGKKKAEDQVSNLKKELVKQKEALDDLENTQKSLVKELEEKTEVALKVDKLEECVQEMQTELEATQQRMDASSKILNKEQAKSRSLAKHDQAMQSKHEALLQRVDELDQECEELKDRVVELEDENEQFESAQKEVKKLRKEMEKEKDLMKKITNEKKSLEGSIKDLQGMITVLEEDLKTGKEREILMIQYPDLNVGSLPPEATPESTGDIAVDMQRQIQANNIRMQVLQEHNDSLRQTVSKLQGNKPKAQTFQSSGPVPLWKTDNSPPHGEYRQDGHSQISEQHRNLYTYQSPPVNSYPSQAPISDPELSPKHEKSYSAFSHVPQNSPTGNEDRLPPRPPVQRDAGSAKSRTGERSIPSTSVNVAKLAAQGNTSLSAYLKLKKAGSIPGKGGNSEGETVKTRPRSGKANLRDRKPDDGSKSSMSLRIDIPASREGSAMGDRDSHPPNKPRSRPGSWLAGLAGRKPDKPETEEHYSPVSTFVCTACDKMYTTQKDLDIHQSYCYG